ncbi:polyprenol phosphomannose-dependent alpha 1,6 mannosyltransferase MptB [Nocardioides deserti]|uniref:Polyprenol phosphomannose-dependent alpha 1,6 mannosyltransferase MptB n=1 Tax=Nocardioides deserti TaxID=1588644 RepID=A0ABR6UBT0_9ACTN|nr:polyprenol phosphomannose-dependent alpha 1,6 mannosyltransferase MptB [Nocardioides deserti]MBC2961891.1 polyprenol phosphomannose-dependent alpha 1,6 mannosyltransferase MptB [Nocardioides deserti]GGO79599.1 membrane protein [Nocardioides deserti]
MIARGLLGSVLVLLGGLVVSVLPAASPLDDLPLRHHTPGRLVGLVVVVGGLGLLGWAWLELLRAVRRGAGGMLLVHRAAASWSLPLLLAPPMFSRDGWSYAAQGVMARVGVSPYEHGPSVLPGAVVEPVDPMWLDTTTPYGPLPLAWGALAAGFTREPWDLVVAHRLLALVGLALLAWAVPRLAAAAGGDPVRAAAVVLPGPLVVAHGVAGLHNDLLMVGLAAVALVLAVEGHWALGAGVGGAAAAVKLPGGLVCVAIALVSLPAGAAVVDRLRRLAAVGGVSVGVLVGCGVATGLGIGWVHALSVPGVVHTPLSLTTQVGRAIAWAQEAGGLPGPDPVEMVRTAGTLLALGYVAWCALREPTGAPAAAVRVAGLTALAAVVLGPVVHHWYALWAVPFLAATRLGPRASGALVGLVGLGGLVAPLDSSLRARGTDIVVAVLLVVGVAVTQAVGHRRALATAPEQRERALR